LDHERLRAELLAHLAELQTSRARLVATRDRERRRLERDLHDGAQQRIVALTLALALIRTRLRATPCPDRVLLDRVEQANRELRAALADLRTLANGIFPPVLAEEGLSAAIEALAEDLPGRMQIVALPARRLDSAVESAAYRLIAETIKQDGTDRFRVAARVVEGLLVMELEGDHVPPDLGDLEDRVGALDGTIELQGANGHARIRAEIPCGS
jgi:signal transduction histidine kinase